jgi:hypothetical protein
MWFPPAQTKKTHTHRQQTKKTHTHRQQQQNRVYLTRRKTTINHFKKKIISNDPYLIMKIMEQSELKNIHWCKNVFNRNAKKPLFIMMLSIASYN